MNNDIPTSILIERKQHHFHVIDPDKKTYIQKSHSIIEEFLKELHTLEPRIIDFYKFTFIALVFLAIVLLVEVFLIQNMYKIINFIFLELVILSFFY